MRAYYNEHEPFAAAWLAQLIEAGEISGGHVDQRDIQTVEPDDMRGYERAHFFAGIAGWDLALGLAGWPADRPVWTGSCPCQPFSSAGKGGGFDDSRHLWPTWFRLIRECRPDTIFGEQVSSGAGLAWFDHVAADLEAEGYAVGALDTCAAGVGAPHIRQRLYWVAHTDAGGRSRDWASGVDGSRELVCWGDTTREHPAVENAGSVEPGQGGGVRRPGAEESCARARDRSDLLPGSTEPRGLGHTSSRGLGADGSAPRDSRHADESDAARSLGHSQHERPEGQHEGGAAEGPAFGAHGGPWSDAQSILCRDGKVRVVPAEPSLFPVAHGLPNRVGQVRGAGNSLCVPQAVAFIGAFLEVMG